MKVCQPKIWLLVKRFIKLQFALSVGEIASFKESARTSPPFQDVISVVRRCCFTKEALRDDEIVGGFEKKRPPEYPELMQLKLLNEIGSLAT